MKTLLVGADRDGVRLLIIDHEQVIADTYQRAVATHRNERDITEAALRVAGESWATIDQFVVLAVPHSHTSVRVVTTMLRTSAWYYGRPCYELACEELEQLSVSAVTQRLRQLPV